jgi:hypothetical protein
MNPGEWDLTVLGDGVTVPSNTAIDRNCTILPHTGPEEFFNKVIPANSIVSMEPFTNPSSTDKEKERVCSNANKSLSTPQSG